MMLVSILSGLTFFSANVGDVGEFHLTNLPLTEWIEKNGTRVLDARDGDYVFHGTFELSDAAYAVYLLKYK